MARQDIPDGVHKANAILEQAFPPGVRQYWQDCRSISAVIYNQKRSLHPKVWWNSMQVVRHMLDLEPDVIHLDDVSFRLAPMVPVMSRTPLVLSIHDPEAHSGERNWRTQLGRAFTFPRASHFVTHSVYSRDALLRRYKIAPEKVSVVKFGALDIYEHWANPRIDEQETTVLFFGRISPYKGLEVLFEAVEYVAARVSGLRLIIAGQPVPGYSLPAYRPLPNGGIIEVLPEYVSNSQLANLFGQAALVVCPYTDATQSAVVLTAYAFGKPVVVTNVGGLPEYVLHDVTGKVVPPRDHSALADAIVQLLLNKDKRTQMSRAISQLSQGTLNWRTIAETTVNVYQEIV
jgi:glycosyltransferase involved in cell wall biosynthesis